MKETFAEAAIAIAVADFDALERLLAADPGLATYRSPVGHPTLLQAVACEERDLPQPVEAARILVDAGSETTWPLISAAGCNSAQVMRFLLDSGVPVDGTEPWTPLDEALYWNNREIVGELIDRGAEVRSLRAAAGLGDLHAVDRFLTPDGVAAAGAGPIRSPFPETVPADLADDRQSILDNAFVMAVNSGHRSAAERLLAAGAAINAKPPGFHWHGAALHAACWRGDADIVSWLLSEGADPNLRDGMEGVNADAVGWARYHGNDHLVPLLEA